MNYPFLKPKEHIITIRDRNTGFAHQHRYWNNSVIEKVLSEQTDSQDLYVQKYPSSRLIDTIILDFDCDEDISLAYKDAKRLKNYLEINGLNSVLVSSGSKGYHLYIQIAPFLFKDTEYRAVNDWNSYFNAFVCFLIHDGEYTYDTLDAINSSAGLNGNIRLIGSIHPKTGNRCEIIEGSFSDEYVVTELQDEAQKKAFCKIEIVEEKKQRKLRTTKVVGNDPIKNNDLRDVFEQLGCELKHYPKGYAYAQCPNHNDNHPSLLITHDWFSCSADCGFKGNIWTLKKLGYVKFDSEGRVI